MPPEAADVVILGAGVTGASIAFHMSEAILDGRATTVGITPFRPSRFGEGQPIKAEFEYRDD